MCRVVPLSILVVMLAACSQNREVTTAAPAPVATAPDDCTFETVLKPGIAGSPGNLIPSTINPNGMSELATLMRLMVEDLKVAREAVVKDQAPPAMFERHRRIRCSWPTQPSQRNAQFDSLALVYLTSIKALDGQGGDRKTAFGSVVASCRGCHENTCEGPLGIIDGLRLDAPAQ